MRSVHSLRLTWLLALACATALHIAPASAGTSCLARFAVPDSQSLGALQFDVDYAGSTFIPGSGNAASCSNVSGSVLHAFNDDDGLKKLHVAIASESAVSGPTYIAECITTGIDSDDPANYTVSVIDSVGTGTPGFTGTNICGAPWSGHSPPYARDARTAISAAVGNVSCPLCECDTDNGGVISSSDALRIIRAATGQAVTLDCGSCGAGSGGFGPSQIVGMFTTVTCNGVGCGNGVREGADECDDGDADDTDLCNHLCESACPSIPRGDCRAAGKSKISIKGDGSGDKDKLQWKWGNGPEVLYPSINSPLTGNTYQLCLYPNGSLLTEIELPSPTGWTTKDPKSYTYADKTATFGGVAKLQIAAGAAEKSKLSLKGSGTNLPIGLLPATTWTIQLADNASGTCWSSSFPTPSLSDATNFKASNP